MMSLQGKEIWRNAVSIECQGACVEMEGHLYVPAKMVGDDQSTEDIGSKQEQGDLHERVNLLTTSKPESALTAAIAKRALSN